MSERSRNHLYTGLCTVIEDEEAVQEMLSHFPARDLDELVTRDHLRAEMAEVRAEMAEGFARADRRLAEEIAALRMDVSTTMRNWTLGGVGLMVAAGSAGAAILQVLGS